MDLSTLTIAPLVPLWEGVRALSLGLDLTMGRRPGHAQATAGLSLAVAARLGLSDAEREGIALGTLLKDAG